MRIFSREETFPEEIYAEINFAHLSINREIKFRLTRPTDPLAKINSLKFEMNVKKRGFTAERSSQSLLEHFIWLYIVLLWLKKRQMRFWTKTSINKPLLFSSKLNIVRFSHLEKGCSAIIRLDKCTFYELQKYNAMPNTTLYGLSN